MYQACTIHEVNTGDFSVRSVLLRGSRFDLVWDTLSHPDDMIAFAQACSDRTCFVVYSHADWDHVFGTMALSHGLVVGHRACAARFETDVPATLDKFQAKDPDKWKGLQLIAPSITFDRHLDIELGNLLVSLHHLPGHTKDSIVAFVPSLKLLLAGDTLELPCPCVPQECELGLWIRSLERWREHPGVRRIIPSHGPTGGMEILDSTIAYLDGLRKGEPIPMPADMPTFSARVHEGNLRHLGLRP